MDAEILHIFDAYTQGTLPVAEQQAFEQRLKDEPELQKEFGEYLHIVSAVNAYERERIKSFLKDRQLRNLYRPDGWKAFRRVAAAAAIILLLVVPGYLFFRSTTYPQRLAKEFYIADPGLPVMMGASATPMLDQAMIEYKDGKYDETLIRLKQLLVSSPANDTLNYYAGICCYELLKNDEAIGYFRKISGSGSPYYFIARYNEGLALLRDGKKQEAKGLFQLVAAGESGPLKEKAQQLLDKM